jgi:hypothetical protein
MTSSTQSFITNYGVAVEAFNRDDLGPFQALFAEECEFTASAGLVGRGPTEIIKALGAGRAAGWVSHNTLGIMSAGEFVVTVYRNDYADGTSALACGALRLNADGKVSEVRTLEPR